MNTKDVFNCILCKDVFDDRESLQIHFRKHGDPNFNVAMKQKSRQSYELPSPSTHKSEEAVSCDVCDEQFQSISKAITHKHKAHPDHESKYFCPWCGKLFTLQHLYNKHIQASHDSTQVHITFHCDTCIVDFYSAAAMNYHNTFFHKQDTELSNVGDSKKLKIYNEELLPIYYCPFCGDEYNNKVNLHKHMKDEHMDENQSPDEVLRCPLCEAIFYHLDAYELHLTFHSLDDRYNEKEELLATLSEISLEAVPPLMEKVETLERLAGSESSAGVMGIDKFLELGMEESNNSSGEQLSEKHTSKKKKKRKKSKKSAITLDEFLSMNQDVFGEGLDFEGIEEVPTRVIAKQIKKRRIKPPPSEVKKIPVANSSDIERLKKQGISVKVNSNTSKKLGAINADPKLTVPLKAKTQIQSNVISTTNDVLSKLLNQSNNQIKIVKKSVQENKAGNEETKEEQAVLSHSHTDHQNVDAQYIFQKNNVSETLEDAYSLTEMKAGEEVIKTFTKIDEFVDNNMALNEECEDSLKNELCSDDIDNSEFERAENIHDVNKKTVDSLKALNKNITVKSIQKTTNSEIMDDSVETDLSKPFDLGDVFDQSNKEEKMLGNGNANIMALKKLGNQLKVTKTVEKKCQNPLGTDSQQEPHEFVKDNVLQKTIAQVKPARDYQEKPITNKSMDPPKFLNHQITVKSIPTIKSQNVTVTDNCEGPEYNEDTKLSVNTTEPEIPSDDEDVNDRPLMSAQTNIEAETDMKNCDNTQLSSSIKLLKHLKNVTAKPVAIKVANQTRAIECVQNKNEHNKGEIFNIDDSDSEIDDHQHSTESHLVSKQCHKIENVQVNKQPLKISSALNNIGKHITIKSNKMHPPISKPGKVDTYLNNKCDEFDEMEEKFFKNVSTPTPKQNATINTLKKLGQHITIKGNNSFATAQIINSYDTDDNLAHEDGDSDAGSDQVKITELLEEGNNLDSATLAHKSSNSALANTNVQFPNESNSDNDESNNDEDEDFLDIENQITSSKVIKTQNENLQTKYPLNINRFQNVTIKSLNEKKSSSNINEDQANSKIDVPSTSKDIKTNIKPNLKNQTLNQAVKSNQKVSIAANQVNTVNKEVTVKSYQSQTIIEEVTTTVTKTVRTVNQTVKQTGNMNQTLAVRPRTLQGPKPQKPQVRNFQGGTFRHPTPNVRPVTVRPPNFVRPGTPVKSSNALVPVRPAIIRPNNPKPIIKPSTSTSQNQVIGRQLKISPNVLCTTVKHPNTSNECSGFKKPEEFLAGFDSDDEDSEPQYASTSHATKSNFVSMTKTVQGGSTVISTKMKSEMSATSQQLNRLSNVAGLTIKSNQVKQSTQMEKKCENIASKRALEAIEKLQLQGLLVKKPRIDESVDDNWMSGEEEDEIDQNLLECDE